MCGTGVCVMRPPEYILRQFEDWALAWLVNGWEGNISQEAGRIWLDRCIAEGTMPGPGDGAGGPGHGGVTADGVVGSAGIGSAGVGFTGGVFAGGVIADGVISGVGASDCSTGVVGNAGGGDCGGGTASVGGSGGAIERPHVLHELPPWQPL